MIKAGEPAPNFVAPAYYKERFTHIDLSKYRRQMGCGVFYGGDYLCLNDKCRQLPTSTPNSEADTEFWSGVDTIYVHKVWNESSSQRSYRAAFLFPCSPTLPER